MRLIARLLFWITGWKAEGQMPEGLTKCVMTAAPHTSNWDIVYTRAAFYILRIPVRFAIKKEWLDSPIGWLIRALGGIGIDRTPRNPGEERPSATEAMADLFNHHEGLVVLIAPEGTRSLRTKWKSGYYWTAVTAQVPIVLGFLDYDTKTAGTGPAIYPTGDHAADQKKINDFYVTKGPKIPSKFSPDTTV